MADERLRLVAEVTDQFTGPLGKLETTLRRTAQTGIQVGKDLKKDFDAFHGTLGKTTATLQGMAPALSALGAGGLAAGLSLGAITTALRGFSTGTQQLSIMSKETGLAVDQLRAFGSLGERFGVSADTMQGGVRKFSEEMSRLRKRYGETYSTLQAMNLGDLVEKLVAAPNMKAALDSAMDALSNIGDPVKRRKVAEQLFGGDQIGAVAGQLPGRVSEVLAEIERRQGQTTDAQVKAAQRFEESLSHLRENMDGLRTAALTPLLGEMNRLIELFTTPEATNAFKGQLAEIAKFARTTVQEFEAIVRVWGQVKDLIGLGDPSLNKEFKPGLDGGSLVGPQGGKTRAQLEGRKFSVEQQRDLLDKTPNTPDYQRKRDRMTEELKRVADELEKLRSQGGATAQPSSFGGVSGAGGPLIQKASFGGGGYGGGGPGLGGFGAPLPTLGGGYGSALPRAGSSSLPAGSPSLPPVSSGPLGSKDAIAANPGAYKDVLDHIAQSEGTANRSGGGYNTSLGYGRYLPGHQEQALTEKSLNEVLALGDHMRRQPGNPNSSALGRYQIVGRTMRGLMRKMGLTGDEKFDEKMQDRMGAELARARGSNPTGLGQEWASLRGQRLARAVDLMQKIDPSASTMPSSRVAAVSDGGSLDAPGSGDRSGDKMMRRFYGDEAPSAKGSMGGGKGSLDITLHGFPAGAKPRASMDDLFKEVNVSKSRQMDTTSI